MMFISFIVPLMGFVGATTLHPKMDCEDSLLDGGSYETYPGSILTCRHGNYLTSYAPDLRAPDWSAYHITPEEATHEQGGRRKFEADEDIPMEHQAPVKSECWSEKWNRGHLCPSNIMSFDKAHHGHWEDTYYITNTAMQYGPFNQQTWEHVEAHTLNWIRTNQRELYLITGTWFRSRSNPTKCDIASGKIIESGASSIDESIGGISLPKSDQEYMAIPDFYYKIMCDPKEGKSIGYIGHNRADDGVTEHTVEELEAEIGIQLLPKAACNTSAMDTSYWWTEDLQGKVKKIPPRGPEPNLVEVDMVVHV